MMNRTKGAMLSVVATCIAACGGGGGGSTSLSSPPSAAGAEKAPAPMPNVAPQISGTPSIGVMVGQTYEFRAVASDPDSTTLTFGITSKPAWASFDNATGRLSGIPAAADAGSYTNIMVSVSDGYTVAALPAFSIAVTKPVIGAAEVTWSTPRQYADGTPVTNLAGYRVRFGPAADALTEVLTVPSPDINAATIEGLAAGTWYFTVASYSDTGLESPAVGPVSKTIT
jgi:hypothetical protein